MRSASLSVLPCFLWPPIALKNCGVRPRCAITGIPESTKYFIVSACVSILSILTALAPAASKRPALSTVSAKDFRVAKNGMSPTMNLSVPARTAAVWSTIICIVPQTVVGFPCITIEQESPIKMQSTFEAPTILAKAAS